MKHIQDKNSFSSRSSDLVTCCRYLADQARWESFSDRIVELPGTTGATESKEILDSIVRIARTERLRAIVQRPSPDRLPETA